MTSASACAKTILFGEHAVVYGEPAIAVPLSAIRTRASLTPGNSAFRVISETTGLNRPINRIYPKSGLYRLLMLIRDEFQLEEFPKAVLKISSDIPIASGLGSGAALSAAVIRAFAEFYDRHPDNETVNRMVYEIEKIYHGTPSGIDNTVIVYEKPMIFTKGAGFSELKADIKALPLLAADTGIRSRTIDAVSAVRANYEFNKSALHQIGTVVREAASALQNMDLPEIGRLMNENQRLLQAIDVSCPELDELTELALKHGAFGAKLTGAGRGGNFIVLCPDREHAAMLRSVYEERRIRVIV